MSYPVHWAVHEVLDRCLSKPRQGSGWQQHIEGLVGDTGLERDNVSACKHRDLQNPPKRGGAESGAVQADFASDGAGLEHIVEAWSRLPKSVRAAIMETINGSGVTH